MLFERSSLCLFLFVSVITNVYSQFSCDDCLVHVNTFSKCVEDYCDDYDPCLDRFYDAQDLGKCCGMPQGGECKKAGKKAQKCFEQCFPDCIANTASDYLDCTFDNGGTDGCDRADCITQLALEKSWLDNLEDGDEIQDDSDIFLNMEKYMEDYTNEDLAECEGAIELGKEVCNVGASCCRSCNNNLGSILDCLVNDLFRPHIFKKRGLGDLDDIQKCRADCMSPLILRYWDDRRLQETNTTAMNVATTMTATTTEGNNTAGSVEDSVFGDDYDYDDSDTSLPFGPFTENKTGNELIVQKCRNRLSANLAMGNETRALNEHVSCIMGESFNNMEDSYTIPKKSSSYTTSSVGAVTFVTFIISLTMV